LELGQFTVRNHSGVRVRGGRGFRDEFSAFHASAYPQLAAQTLAITGDAVITRAATDTTLGRVWRSWPSLRTAADVLVRARWTAVLVAAEQESTAGVEHADAAVAAAVEQITGAVAATADTVVVVALQRLPRVQRRALVLHYMGGVSVRHLSELSGSSAEHVELLLDDGFTALAGSLEWSGPDDPGDADGPDLSFDWVAEALTDTAARLPEHIPAPLPKALLRNATAVRWSVRAIPVAACAACAAVMAAIAQPAPPGPQVSATYAAPAGGAVGGVVAHADRSEPGPTVDGGSDPDVRMRSIALKSLLDAHRGAPADDVDPRPDTRDAEVGRAPQTPAAPQMAQAQRADAGRLVGGAKRAPGATAAKEAPTGRTRPSPTAAARAPAEYPALQAASGGGAAPMALAAPVQEAVPALPTAPASTAEVPLRAAGVAAALTAPQPISVAPDEPHAPTARVTMMGTGDETRGETGERSGSSTTGRHGGKHGDDNTRERRSIR
jgi:RNA polymerase sigma-70 factor, ECF subfamily